MEQDRYMPVNLNNFVKIKINTKGYRILKEQHDHLNERLKGSLGEFQLKVDDAGYTKMQIHSLFNKFGDDVLFGRDLPFEIEVLIQYG